MKLSQFKDKKDSKKVIIILIAIGLLIGGIILGSSFASFKENKSFKVMEGNFIYEGSGDIIFAFYQNDEEVGTMPSKDSDYVFNANDSFCDNGATINWDANEWDPNIRNLTTTKTKCNLYFSYNGTLNTIRTISSTDTKGMWGYKDKITKIVIEANKSKKTGSEGQVVHGPFDESEKKDSSIESYVVCDTGDTNCTGYLQGEGGIKLNSDSSNLFKSFAKVTQIEKIKNLDTRGVTTMEDMFYYMSNLQELDLSSFNTSSVTDMGYMFDGASKLTKITYGSNFIHKDGAKTTNMFRDCPANKPDKNVHSSWNGVSFN